MTQLVSISVSLVFRPFSILRAMREKIIESALSCCIIFVRNGNDPQITQIFADYISFESERICENLWITFSLDRFRTTNSFSLCVPRRVLRRRLATPLRVGEFVLIDIGTNTQVSAFDSFEVDTQRLLGHKKRGDHERRERHEIKTRNEIQGLVNQS
jgi:hypothetical protein